jgi:beta-glucosidase
MQKERILQAQKNLVSVSRQAAQEGIVLLENKEQTLPLKASDRVSLFGRCQIDTYRSGTGSGGAVNVPYAVNALQGLRENPVIQVNEELVAIYEGWIAEHPFDDGGGGWAAEPWFQVEMPLEHATVKEAAAKSGKAIVFIGRTAGEDQDNADEAGSYRLTDAEMSMVEQVTAEFADVIIVLNVTNIIDMAWLSTVKNKQSIKAVLYSWAAGMEGGHALADVLSGVISPSGRLTDSIAHKLSDYPSSANFGRKDYNVYAEDIYVGYRYFETFNPQAVQYEFGAGLSYTKFQHEFVSHSVEGIGIERVLHFNISVKNVGTQHSSKEVVQIYVEAPQGLLGKPARVLAGFAKTQVIKPGEEEVVHVSVPVKTLASFDDSGVTGHQNSYLLEAGQYQFHAGPSVRKAKKIPTDFILEHELIIEELSEALAPIKAFDRLKPAAKKANDLYEPAYEPVSLRSVSMADRIKNNMPPTYEITGDKGIKLADVKEGDATLEAFVAQLSREQLATIVRGEGMCSPKVTPGTAAAFGGVCESLFNFGIPIAAAADGPSGIRMDSGHKATQVPIGTLLACTWNTDLNQKLFELVGDELQANEIDTLLGPGINVHRHPLNGRNFEYFSEDPLLSGIMAAAQTRGLKEAGVSGTIKHFAANDQETARVDVDSVASARALREIHLKPFEMAVKDGHASTIMTGYNPINGHWTASNYDLNTTILRGEWGFTGIVMTDWWAKMNDPVDAGKESRTFTSFMIRAQNDLYMVVENDGAENNSMADNTLEALENGTLTEGELQRSAMNICRFIMDAPVMTRPLVPHEPVKTFKPNPKLSNSDAVSIEDVIKLDAKTNTNLIIEVKEDGVYHCSGQILYDRNPMAQSTCSLSFDHVFSMTFSVHGTDGKVHKVEGLTINLAKGLYELSLDFVKPGLEIESLEFTKV